MTEVTSACSLLRSADVRPGERAANRLPTEQAVLRALITGRRAVA